MIEAIGRQPAGMLELQNNRQRLWVNSDFAAVFRGATNESQAPGELPIRTRRSARAAEGGRIRERAVCGIELWIPHWRYTTNPRPLPRLPAELPKLPSPNAKRNIATDPAGWSGPPGLPGSSYNPIAAWDQVPGQQPAWITGTYPGADWTAVSEQGFLMPYSGLAPGPGEDVYSNANANVINQDWAKYYGQMDGTQAGNQIVWGANNPTDAIPAPWMASTNPDPQYTAANPSNTSQPTQPHYVPPNPAS